jgi:predicted Zn-dependent protease
VNPRFRVVALAVLMAGGLALVAVLYVAKIGPPLDSTLTTSMQVLGAPVKLVDRAASRVLPVDDLDEKALGDAYREDYDSRVNRSDPDQRYLDELLQDLITFSGKGFPYRAYVLDDSVPNAAALPGGVLLVTRGLLTNLHSESEVVSVLAHEMGHVELGHCFDAVRFELLSRKAGAGSLGQLADFGGQLLLRHTYSKTIEHEADEYAFLLMTGSRYDPRGMGGAFRSLEAFLARRGERTPASAEPLRDYFESHPPVEIRAIEYGQRADAWWRTHSNEKRYVGIWNLAQRVPRTRRELSEELAH